MSNDFIKSKLFNIILLSFFLIIAIILWDTLIIYPVKVFVVILHEISHGIVAVLTGGEIVKIEIDANIGGACYTAGGSTFFVASAGYIGSIILGGIILLSTSKLKNIKILGYFISIFIFIITVAYIRNTFGFIFGLAFSIILFFITRFSAETVLQYLMKFIGIVSCFYVLIDIKEDLFTTEYRGSDANLIASITGIPSLIWAVLWIIISVISFIYFLRKSLK